MIRIAVCDDDVKVLNDIETYLKEYQNICKHEFCIKTFKDGSELLNCTEYFDLLFLDVEMPNTDGIKTAQTIRKKGNDVQIIYVTSYTKYALNVLAVHTFDFIEKPISKERLYQVLRDYFKLGYKNLSPVKNIINLKGIEKELIFNVSDIYLFKYVENKRIMVYTKTGDYLIKGSIKDIAQQVEDFNTFVSPHQSFIINMEQIYNIEGFIIIMNNNEEADIAQKRYNDFITTLNKYYHSKM